MESLIQFVSSVAYAFLGAAPILGFVCIIVIVWEHFQYKYFFDEEGKGSDEKE